MSTRILSDPKVEQLGERHGAVGPLVWVSLLCHAGAQEAGGKVERTYRATAHEVFSDSETVSAVVDSAVELGLCHAVSRDVHGFILELSAWKRWQAAGRKARERAARKPHEQADVTDSHAVSRDVPYKTIHNKKKEQTRASAHLQPIFSSLEQVTFSRSLPSVKVDAVVKVCEKYADRDLVLEAEKFAHYYTDGAGENRTMRDVVAALRNWLNNAPSAAKAQGAQRKQPATVDRSRYEEKVREVAV
jgi:hypothetical protein